MNTWVVVVVLLLNLVISWFNAVSAGKSWAESRALGGFIRLMTWCAAIQSAIGFSGVILALLAGLAYLTGHLPPAYAGKAFALWYVLIIVPAIGTGLLITIESWVIAFRDRSLMNMGTAAYNTLAMAHNLYGMTQHMGEALGEAFSLFSPGAVGDDDEGLLAMLVIGLVVAALAAGCLLTAAIIQRYAGTRALPVQA